ncbi:tetratricopeptide repeat protein [Flavobacterium sp.]|uniref:tetratricopeptide repeat protein n=1 Tax=Flavobacterium sp. TaxID=239 RepID=UPI00286C9A9C|nr:tetratricopeptide repeat protein [Flavobacterium sp.]
MKKIKQLSLSQLGLYNPQRLDDETVENLFVVRQKYFLLLMDKIKKEKANSIPQHYLFIGQRGMGKSTLLKRIEVELRKKDSKFIPLLFPEEQYNLSNLAEFWLNSLDAMADALELVKSKDEVNLIDSKVKELQKSKDDDEVARQAFQFLIEMSNKINKRPVLLIDNMSFIFDRLDKSEQHILRAWLMQNNAPILIGASAVDIEDTINYGAPFYDAFQTTHLNRLKFEELLDILNNLAQLTNAQEVLANIHDEIGRLKTIHQLTGGNPRTAVMLFKIIVKGFSKEINDDLEALLDEITPLYKARFEELSNQSQIIVDAIALHWDPMNLEQLRNETKLENGQLSPQLKRLVELGWIERLDAYKAKGSAYQISERFFNIWFLMRRSSRRQKKELYCLSKFLETFYGDDLHEVAKNSLSVKSENVNQITYKLALAEAVTDKNLKKQIKEACHNELKEEAKTNPEVYEKFGLSKEPETDKEKTDFIKLEKTYLAKLKKNNKDADTWFDLAYLYHVNLKKFDEAEKAYLKAIELDKEDPNSWNNLGVLYQDYLQDYKKSEAAFLKAIEIDEKYVYPWYNLGNLYQSYLQDYKKSEDAYLKAIEFDNKYANPWNGLAYLYRDHFQDYKKSEDAYLKAIELNEDNSFLYNRLGNLYLDYLQEYQKAEEAFINAIKISPDNIYAKYNLVFLYRDKINKLTESEDIFNSLDKDINKEIEDSHWLNKSLFELYKRNEGTAKEHLLNAFQKIEDRLPNNTQDDWWRFGAVVTKLGYGNWLATLLEENGFNTILAPYYVAIKALTEKDSEGYLNSKAVEIREPARKIMEIMQKY